MRVIICFVLGIIGACGQGKSSNEGESDSSRFNGDDSTQGAVSNQTAKLYSSKADIPECDSLFVGQLVYIEDEALFYVCDKETLDWEEIDLKAKQVDGKDGLAGKDGKDGVDGAKGLDGAPGKDAKTVGANEWISPLDGKKWFLGASGILYYIGQISPSCGGSSSSPTVEQAMEAAKAGLLIKLASFFPEDTEKALLLTNTHENGDNYIDFLTLEGQDWDLISSDSVEFRENDPGAPWMNIPAYVLCIGE